MRILSPEFVPRVFTSDEKAALLLFGIGWGLALGFFEELGWTGFAVPTLRLRYGVLATGHIVGLLYGAWHFLTNGFWPSGTISGALSLALFVTVRGFGLLVGSLLAFRVLMVWVYDRTESLLVAMLIHASLAASTLILDPRRYQGLPSRPIVPRMGRRAPPVRSGRTGPGL